MGKCKAVVVLSNCWVETRLISLKCLIDLLSGSHHGGHSHGSHGHSHSSHAHSHSQQSCSRSTNMQGKFLTDEFL